MKHFPSTDSTKLFQAEEDRNARSAAGGTLDPICFESYGQDEVKRGELKTKMVRLKSPENREVTECFWGRILFLISRNDLFRQIILCLRHPCFSLLGILTINVEPLSG